MRNPTLSAPRIALLYPASLEREGLAKGLTEAGLEVVAQHGELEAFCALLEHAFADVAILDVSSAALDPAQTVTKVRSRQPRLRILALSSGAADPLVGLAWVRCLEARQASLASLVAAVRALSPSGGDVLTRLSSREREVLGFVAAGADNLKIAAHLGISERTVKAHVSSLLRKLGCRNRTEVALRALQLQVVPRADA